MTIPCWEIRILNTSLQFWHWQYTGFPSPLSSPYSTAPQRCWCKHFERVSCETDDRTCPAEKTCIWGRGERERERQRERVCPAKSATLKYLFYMYFIYLKDKFKNVFFYSTYLTLREPKSPEAKPVPLVRELPSSRLFGQYHHCFDTHRWTLLLNCRKRHAHLFLRQQWEQRLSKPFGWLLWTFGFPKAFVTSAMNYGTWAIFIFINENLCFPPVIPQKSQFPSHQIGWGRMTVSPWVYLLSFLTVDTASPIL